MITINNCLNFKHKYEIAPKDGRCLVNALPRDILNHILSYLWVGLRSNEVCKVWNEYFVEVLKQDLVVWNILARALELPDSRSSLVVRRRKLICYLRDIETTKDLKFYEWFFEHAIQSSFFENVFSIASNRGNGFSPLIRLNALDEVLADKRVVEISKEDAKELCARLIFRGDVEKALKFAKSWKNQELLLEIAKALPSIGHYSRSLEIAKEFEPKEKGCVYGINASWILELGEEEKGMVLVNMTPEDSPCAKAWAFSGLAFNFLGQANLVKAVEMMEKMEALAKDADQEEVSGMHGICDAVLMEISKAFNRKGDTEGAIKMAERLHADVLRNYFVGSFKKKEEPLSCILM